MIQDMVCVYLAMAQYYILNCPYPIMVLIFVTEKFFPAGLILWFLPWVFEWFIRGGQWCLYQVSRLFPALYDICSKVDSVLNSWGLWLEGSADISKESTNNGSRKGKKRIPVLGIYALVLLFTCVFLIAPYYLEPKLIGNSQQVCADINQFIGKKVTYIQEFVDRYYTPKDYREEVMEEPVIEEEEHIILHLGTKGRDGSNLRSSPEQISGNIVGTVCGDVELVFENEIQETEGTIWVKVSTDEISEAWISKSLLDEEEAELFL